MSSILQKISSHFFRHKSDYAFAVGLLLIGLVFHAHNSLRQRHQFALDKLDHIRETLAFQRLFISPLKELYPEHLSTLEEFSDRFENRSLPSQDLLESGIQWYTFVSNSMSDHRLAPRLQQDLLYTETALNSALIRYAVEQERFDSFQQKKWVSLLTFTRDYASLAPLDISALNTDKLEIVY